MQRSAGGATGAGRDGAARRPAADRDALANADRDRRADRDALADAGRDCRADRDALANGGGRANPGSHAHADADRDQRRRRRRRPRPPRRPRLRAFRYDTYDTTGEVAEPGSYAFLADPADTTSAVTTYEALRDGTTTALLIHKSDAHGASQAALYDAVEAGDLFEWHEADDCFVRYKVTEVKPDPAGAVPRKLLAVEWMTYAFTGCSGAVSANAPATVDWR